jgi:C-terminal processing protease CtpA/Prc
MEDIIGYIEGIGKASFCKPMANQPYISFAHFLSLQSRECLKTKDEYYPDAMILGDMLYIWLPTPPKKGADQVKYAKACRERLVAVVTGATFNRILIDVRGNIGGVLATVVDAIYPLLTQLRGKYLSGVDKNGKEVTTFELVDGKHILNPSGHVMVTDMLPVEPELVGIFDKPIIALCNRYTMSTGEIICIIVRKLGGKLYGERTRGLTNGMEIISNSNVKSVLIPYYSIADGEKIYRNGVTPDFGEFKFGKTG